MKKEIIFVISLILFVVIGFIACNYSKWQEERDFHQLKNKVTLVNELFLNGGNVHKIKNHVEKKVVHSKQKKVEKSVNSYLIDLISIYQDANSIMRQKEYESMFLTTSIQNDHDVIQNNISLLEKNKKRLEEIRDGLKELSTSEKRDSYAKKDILDSYLGVVKNVNMRYCKEYMKIIDTSISDIDKEIILMNYLMNHLDSWKITFGGIEFQTRNIFLEFDKIEKTTHSKNILYQLIEDHEGPVIHAQDISLYVNQMVDLNSKFQCNDVVDGDVSCMIDGDYDNQKVGSYPISIKAKDQSNNMSEKTIIVKVLKKVSDKPYAIDVIRNQNVVVVYGQDDSGEYTKIVQVFTCSTGRDNATPTGTFYTTKGNVWGSLYGGVWGQYTTRITGDILFHSVPYYSQYKGDLEWEEYNKLGTQASLGCVRLAVRDVKWIFDNCPVGTRVHIFDGNIPSGVWKPSTIQIDGNHPNRGWDPTDTDSSNPWNA